MNRNVLCTVLIVMLALCFGGCSSNSPAFHVFGIRVVLSTPPPANMVEGTSAMVAATVMGDSSNGGVDWSCSTTGATACSAANFSSAHTASGGLTTFTAPLGVEMVTITATSTTDMTKSASANVNVTTSTTSTNYSFYMSGQEAINFGPNYYALAGAVTIDSNGNVTGGVQDYNDSVGITSPEPSGDTITGGMLAVNANTGQGTLTLITNNVNVGVGGTETLGVQFVNTSHALIVQFDGTATSSGSMDAQTLPSTVSGGYAFILSGVAMDQNPVGVGGVFSVSGGAITTGTLDINDTSGVTLGQGFTGTVMPAGNFGRGIINFTINPQNLPASVIYYIVGPEVIRMIDVDMSDSAVGSAFGQGAGGFTNASLGSTVFALADNPFSAEAGAVGMFSTSNTGADPSNFAGVGEDSELGNGVQSPLASPISGTYTIMPNGYGSLTIGVSFGDVSRLGIYMVDPNLNLNDPNNTTSGGGGAVVNDFDSVLGGTTGVLIPQTDPSTGSFAGNYTVGMQAYNDFNVGCFECEFDAAAQGSVTGGALNFTGLVSDPFFTLTGAATSTGDTFTGTPLADGGNPGRYSMLSTNLTPNPLVATVNGTPFNFDLVMYQASGGQLFWLNYDTTLTSVFVGPLEQQGSLTGLPPSASQKGGKKAAAQQKTKH